ncbi:hypothetical protein MMC29_006253 [Sticta canariensis]|nr:hypothetical protein [Sticta canariensis]
MSRLSSAFEAPLERGSMLAQLEGNVLESSFMAKMAIVLAHEDADALASVEPLPHIDYNLVHALIKVAGGTDKRAVKLFDYLIDGRKYYYNSHSSFHTAFVRFQDTRAYGLLLEREKTKLAKLGSSAAKELESNEIALRKNYHALHLCLEEVYACRENRAQATTQFSKMKYLFLNTQMPRLIYVGKKMYQNAMEAEGQPSHPVPPVPASQPCVTQTAVAPPHFESLTGMLNTDMNEEDLLNVATRINNHAQ